MSEVIFYKNEAIIFGKVECTHCGINTDLMYVELSGINEETMKISTHETTLCRDCYRALPIREEKNYDDL